MVDADEITTAIVNNRFNTSSKYQSWSSIWRKSYWSYAINFGISLWGLEAMKGKLQVHLAQTKYMLPKISWSRIVLSRQAGGTGSRGPGESQLELNRRSVQIAIEPAS